MRLNQSHMMSQLGSVAIVEKAGFLSAVCCDFKERAYRCVVTRTVQEAVVKPSVFKIPQMDLKCQVVVESLGVVTSRRVKSLKTMFAFKMSRTEVAHDWLNKMQST